MRVRTAILGHVVAVAVLCAACSDAGVPRETPRTPASPDVTDVPRQTTPAVFPMDLTDLGVEPPEVTSESDDLGAPTERPWLGPGTPMKGGRVPQVLHVRSRTITLPIGFNVAGVLDDAAVGTLGRQVQIRELNGTVRRLARAPADTLLSLHVLSGHLAWRADGAQEDQLFWAGPSELSVEQVPTPHVGKPGGETFELAWVGAVAAGDLVFQAWGIPGSRTALFRTSGKPAAWQLRDVYAASAVSGLVAGRPAGALPPGCIAVYRADATAPLWTRCFTRDGSARPVQPVGFSPSGRRIALVIPGLRRPPRHTSVRRSTLVVLDAFTGGVVRTLDRNPGWQFPVFEDERHLVLGADSRPIWDVDTESPFDAWLVRCSLRGACEPITPRVRTSNYGWTLRLAPSAR